MPEDDATVLFGLDPRFPFEDVEAIGARFMASIARGGSIGREDPPGRPVNKHERGDTQSLRNAD